MLVLSRKTNEEVVVDNAVVTVVEIRGDKVRLGFEAPSAIPIHRREVHDAILREMGGLGIESGPLDPLAAGVVVHHPNEGFWPETFIAGNDEESRMACWLRALQLAHMTSSQLLRDARARVVEVRFICPRCSERFVHQCRECGESP